MTGGDLLQRLWAPHRMAYVTGDDDTSPERGGCPFCRIPTMAEPESLVVSRAELAYAVLNMHPYNPGHLMVVPYRHIAEYEELSGDEVAAVGALTQQAVRAIRVVAAPHGFNVGINLGGVAGGSVTDHVHQHVVPRWSGDANFITVVGETKVLPQLLADTRDLLAGAWAV